jgi:hypothetical protein
MCGNLHLFIVLECPSSLMKAYRPAPSGSRPPMPVKRKPNQLCSGAWRSLYLRWLDLHRSNLLGLGMDECVEQRGCARARGLIRLSLFLFFEILTLSSSCVGYDAIARRVREEQLSPRSV